MSKENGGPAFPLPAHKQRFGPGTAPLFHNAEPGMTLRDYFAAKAMREVDWHNNTREDCANECYEIADAMLTERSKP